MNFKNEFLCSCGKVHNAGIGEYIVKSGAVNDLPFYINKYNCKKVFVFSDKNTFLAAGQEVQQVLSKNNISFTSYVFEKQNLEPDEASVGSAVMHFDHECDIIVAVGSGVINDIGKIIAKISKTPYIIVATAPSMDGYASSTSSVLRDGLKISLPAKCADVVIGDIDILKNAPERMLISGFGDMIAKYISICEWRISHVINGEYYCEEIAELTRKALKACTDNVDKLLHKDEETVKAVFEGLLVSGIAMNYAGISRPASGGEHYLSHIWDMRGVEFGENVDFHGIQCGVATMYYAKLYDRIKAIIPDKQKALEFANNFDFGSYSQKMKEFLGKSAISMIQAENNDGKYDKIKHKKRIDVILNNWDKIIQIINEEIPSSEIISSLLDTLNAPKTAREIGIDENTLQNAFIFSADIRDKYVLPRLLWDLGIVDEVQI